MSGVGLHREAGDDRLDFDAVLFDLDGVLYIGAEAVPGAVEAVAALRHQGIGTCFVTNNAARPPAAVAAHLRDIGIHADIADVTTSAMAGARVLAERFPPGSSVLAVGGPGVADALQGCGLAPVTSADDEPVAVMQGFGSEVGWRELVEVGLAVRRGAWWLATNSDITIPTPRGQAPGNGSLVAAAVAAAGRQPDFVAGKPEPALLREAVHRCGAKRPLMVGDRLDTDIAGGNRLGIPTLLVLTGVTDRPTGESAAGDERPTFVAPDLSCLLGNRAWRSAVTVLGP